MIFLILPNISGNGLTLQKIFLKKVFLKHTEEIIEG